MSPAMAGCLFTFGCATLLAIYIADAEEYTARLIDNEYDCNVIADYGLTSNDTCYVNVDEAGEDIEIAEHVRCGVAGQCIISCNVSSGLGSANISAEHAQSLIINSSADNCLSSSMVYAPNTGNATIYVSAHYENARGMRVQSGNATNSISITCSGPDSEPYASSLSCSGLVVDARSSSYFELVTDQYYANIASSAIVCPDGSTEYTGPEEAPCIINASSSFVDAQNMIIHTVSGSPTDFILYSSSNGNYTGTRLYCLYGDSEWSDSSYSFGVK